MLQYLYGMDYLEEPEDDTFSMIGSQKKAFKSIGRDRSV